MTRAAIAPSAHDIASTAADAFRARDKLAADLAALDRHIKQLTRDYGDATRMWALTPLILRQACESRGLIDKEA